MPVISAAMKKCKMKLCKVVSILMDKSSPSELGTTSKKAHFGYSIQMFSKMVSFNYCLKQVWAIPQAKISEYISVFSLKPDRPCYNVFGFTTGANNQQNRKTKNVIIYKLNIDSEIHNNYACWVFFTV